MDYRILALGDVASETGLQLLEKKLRTFKREQNIAFTVVNGENISGSGLTRAQAEDLLAAGADVVTLGNHTWSKLQIADYLDDATLLEHIPAHVTASNVAPQYGTEETRAYLKLCATEQILVDNGLCDDPSDLYHTLLVKAIKTERWRKWMTGDDVNLQVDDILADDELSLKILDVSGHYAFNDPEVKEQVEKLYRNLAAQDIDGKRFVIEHIKRPIKQYVVGLNLKGVTTRIEAALAE